MDEVMEVLGITSLVLLAVAFLTGLLMKRRRADLMKIHRIVGYIVLAVAICHGMLSMLD
jgi:cell shape-determining protein MreD